MWALCLRIINMSIQASLLVVIVVLMRLLLKKAPKWIHCLLWILVAIRLVCPFSIESAFSLAPNAEVVSTNIYEGRTDIKSGYAVIDRPVGEYLEKQYKEADAIPKGNDSMDILNIVSLVWICGMIAMALYATVSYLKIKIRVKESVNQQDNIYACDYIDTPFILGIIKPHIYVPSNINSEQMESVMAHEKAHLKRMDHIWKPLGYTLLAIYWFNPFCWLAYILLCRDIEMACDEKVIKDMDLEQKKIYSKVLLSFSTPGKMTSACPLAFGEVGVKKRIKSVLNYKKPAFWIIICSIIIMTVVSACFLTNPQGSTYELTFRVPAGSENQLIFSEEEISPQRNHVIFMVGQELGDTEILVQEVEWKDGNSYVKSIDTTSGVPSKMELERDKWFQVAIHISNETDEEQIVHVSVKNVEVRISSNDRTMDGEEKNIKMIQPWGKDGIWIPQDTTNANLIWPTRSTVISSQRDTSDEESIQYSVNIAGKTDDPIYAVADGYILKTDFDTKLGNYIILQTDSGYTCTYEHLKEVNVKDGQEVKAADTIGTMGSTGQATGPNLGLSVYHENDIDFYIMNLDENMGVKYRENPYTGDYIVEDDMVYMYKLVLTGKDPNAAHRTQYIVLTNDQNVTYEQVSKSLYSSDIADWLPGTLVIGIKTIE